MLTPQAIHLGPLMLPWGLIIPLCSLMLTLLLTTHPFKQKFQVTAEQWNLFKDSIWTAILLGLVFARIGFVLLNFSAYLEHPIEILKFQDKGFNLYIGLIVGSLWIILKNKALKKVFLILIFGLFIVLNSIGFRTLHHIQQQYQQFPKVELLDLQHNSVKLQQFAGKPLVINLWASWCPPCHREMPVLNQAQIQYKNVQFIFINQGEDSETIQRYLQKNQLQLQYVLLDPQGLTAQSTGMYGMPSTLFFDAQGKLIETHMGEISHAVLAQKIQKLVSKSK
ncbi:TlpA disulfide reductase family protein [Acinetobacter sp. ANC 4648]|uniref:TlpA disulfide reductase family protein n=1 Tax=Acinetobacter sp. ANC 4648 TaxID=1977875 RepID=UPI000A34A6A3|nr:TlpA disulfide reductase family protein [Acinetobacter sp. ANC 4648]OTG80364.1 redoxin [Acinetobacter sp. ANC 4648]